MSKDEIEKLEKRIKQLESWILGIFKITKYNTHALAQNADTEDAETMKALSIFQDTISWIDAQMQRELVEKEE